MDVLQNIGIDIATMVPLVAYIVRMEMKQKELVARREEDQESAKESISEIETANKTLAIDMKAYFKDAKKSRETLRDYLKEELKELESTMHERVNIVKSELKEHRSETKDEFKEINQNLTALAIDSTSIKSDLKSILKVLDK